MFASHDHNIRFWKSSDHQPRDNGVLQNCFFLLLLLLCQITNTHRFDWNWLNLKITNLSYNSLSYWDFHSLDLGSSDEIAGEWQCRKQCWQQSVKESFFNFFKIFSKIFIFNSTYRHHKFQIEREIVIGTDPYRIVQNLHNESLQQWIIFYGMGIEGFRGGPQEAF